jgi:hypothetical protein
MQNKLNAISSDSFCLNAMYLMHELCLPFLDLNDSKQLWTKIDPTYLPSGVRIDITDETPICASRDLRQGISFPKEFGTITEFYFMEFEMIHFGLLHTFRKYQDIMKMMDRLKEERKAHEGGSQDMLSKFDHELKILRNFRIAYELTLCDQTLAKLAEKFYAVHMSCMKIWGNFEEKQVKFGGGAGSSGSHPNLFCYIPENFLTDFIECFSDIMRANPRGYKAFMAETAV